MNRPALRWLASLALAIILAGCGNQPSAPPTVSEIPIVDDADKVPANKGPVRRPDVHIVKKGETLGEIAFNYGLAYTDLALWNNLPNPNLIEVNQQLQLHPPQYEPVVSAVKKVAKKVPVPVSAPGLTTQVTRTRVDISSGTAPRIPRVSNPQAIKINYSQANLDRLLLQATGGVKQASLTIRPDGQAQATVPRNSRNTRGITWSWPVKGKLVKQFSDTNRGIDIGGPRGQPVFASADGKVIYAGSGLKGYGQLVIIKHANEYLSTYAHNDSILVAEGEEIRRGTKIAEMGDSGADQVALHFGIRRGEEAYNPQQFLPKLP